MEEQKSKETQPDLFGEPAPAARRTDRFQPALRAQKPILFSTNTEQLLMGGILLILALCGVFFLGVIRGKAIAASGASFSQAVSGPAVMVAAPPQPVRTAVVQSNAIQIAQTPPAVRPAVQAPKQPLPNASKPYTIQIVTHRKKELAEAEMNGLREQGLYSFLIPSQGYFQVCAGQYASKDEAKKDLARFQAKFKDSFLRRR